MIIALAPGGSMEPNSDHAAAQSGQNIDEYLRILQSQRAAAEREKRINGPSATVQVCVPKDEKPQGDMVEVRMPSRIHSAAFSGDDPDDFKEKAKTRKIEIKQEMISAVTKPAEALKHSTTQSPQPSAEPPSQARRFREFLERANEQGYVILNRERGQGTNPVGVGGWEVVSVHRWWVDVKEWFEDAPGTWTESAFFQMLRRHGMRPFNRAPLPASSGHDFGLRRKDVEKWVPHHHCMDTSTTRNSTRNTIEDGLARKSEHMPRQTARTEDGGRRTEEAAAVGRRAQRPPTPAPRQKSRDTLWLCSADVRSD
eukprot:3935150-Rhodomonas_salina.3